MNIKELYNKGINIQKYFRDKNESMENDINGILYSYDYQAGGYIKEYFSEAEEWYLHNGKKVRMSGKRVKELTTQYIAEELIELNPNSILEVGVGEATTLCDIVSTIKTLEKNGEELHFNGLELSLSRLLYAQRFANYKKADISFAMGDMFALPYLDNSFDVVLTFHCIESNTGKEKEALKELVRVARKYVVMVEPSYELGNEETKKRIKELCYIENLKKSAEELNLNVIKNEIFKITSYINNGALTIIEKQRSAWGGVNASEKVNNIENIAYACPNCGTRLHIHKEAYFCPECFNLYPVIHNIPILNVNHAILCSKYEEIGSNHNQNIN